MGLRREQRPRRPRVRTPAARRHDRAPAARRGARRRLRGRAFTLVGAPPGWGKTVLLSGWAAERGAAWLTLGARHCDARRLWADVCERAGAARRSTVRDLDDDFPLRLADALAGATERADARARRPRPAARPGARLAGRAARRTAATRCTSSPRRAPTRALPLERLRLSGRLARAARRRPRVHAGGGGGAARGARRSTLRAGPGRAPARAHRGLGGRPAARRPLAARRGRPRRASSPSSPATTAPSPTT